MIVDCQLLRALCFSTFVCLLLSAPARAQPRPEAQESARPSGPGVLSLLPSDSVTEHVLDAGGEKLAYTATLGTFSLFDQDGARPAAIVYTAYTLKGAAGAQRPVTFVFN